MYPCSVSFLHVKYSIDTGTGSTFYTDYFPKNAENDSHKTVIFTLYSVKSVYFPPFFSSSPFAAASSDTVTI